MVGSLLHLAGRLGGYENGLKLLNSKQSIQSEIRVAVNGTNDGDRIGSGHPNVIHQSSFCANTT
jgi:hypothetical protein